MSKYKLILSSIKNQIHIYSIYIISLILSLTFYLTFINLSTLTIKLVKTYVGQSSIYIVIVFLVGLVFTFLIILLINYVQNLLINARSKELAVYKLIAFSSKELRKYLFLEQMIINVGAFIIAVNLATFLTIILINSFNTIVVNLLGIPINLKVPFGVTIYELCLLVITSFIIAVLSNKKVQKKELIDLLNTKESLPTSQDNKYSVINTILVFTTWIGLIYILFQQFDRLKTSTIIIVLFIYIISIFTLYNVLGKVIIQIIPSKLYYRKANSFTISIIKRKLSSNAISMAFVTVLILLSTFTIMFGVINTRFISYLAMYDDVMVSTNLESFPIKYNNKDYVFEFNDIYSKQLEFFEDNTYVVSEYCYNKFLNLNGFKEISLQQEQAVVVTTDSQLEDIVQLQDIANQYNPFNVIEFIKIENNNALNIVVVDDSYEVDSTQFFDTFYEKLDKGETNPRIEKFKYSKLELYDNNELISSYTNIMSESVANNYLARSNIDFQFDLDEGEAGYMGRISYEDKENISLKSDNKYYDLVKVLSTNKLKNLGFGMYILNDEEYNYYDDYTLQYIVSDFTSEYDEKFWSDLKGEESFPGWISIKGERNAELLLGLVSISGALIFISLIMLILLITMIGIQVNIDSLETKEQFNNLRKIGYTKSNIYSIINQVTITYFIIPLLIAIINIIILWVVFSRYLISYTNVSLIFSTGAITKQELLYVICCMLIVYIIYCVLVNISYKRVIAKNFK